jgi:hypothetical protein
MNLTNCLRAVSLVGLLTSVVNASNGTSSDVSDANSTSFQIADANSTSFQVSHATGTSFEVSHGTSFEIYSVAAAAKMNCTSGLRTFDPRLHKREYVIGVDAIRGTEAAMKEYSPVFADYLTATAGQRFVPPITFKILPSTDILADVDAGLIDFFYAGPAIINW